MSHVSLYNIEREYVYTVNILITLCFIFIFTVSIIIRYCMKKLEYIDEKLQKNLNITSYSEKSFVIRGDTKIYKEKIKELGGKWNRNLKGGPGWIFSNNKRTIIDNWII